MSIIFILLAIIFLVLGTVSILKERNYNKDEEMKEKDAIMGIQRKFPWKQKYFITIVFVVIAIFLI